MQRWAIRIILMNSILVGACSTIPKPESEANGSMRAVYDRATTQGDESFGAAVPWARHTLPDYNAYTRSVENETRNLFPRIPNPTLYMYVRPRAVGEDGLPIPGYTVPFSMWERDRHALPGEVIIQGDSLEVAE